MENSLVEEAIISVQDFICRVSDKEGSKTDEEVRILPSMITALIALMDFKTKRAPKE